jgi:invasion protein IalB
MPNLKLFLAALALAAVSLTSVADTVSAQTATEAEPPATEDSPALGEEAEETPKPGETYVKETFGDWALRCIVVAEGEDPCQMYQLLEDQNGQAIAEFTMFRLPEGGEARAGATIVVPLETSLQEQLLIKVDEGSARRYPFAFCNAIGCYARIGLTAEDVDAYKRGSQALLSIVPALAPDQRRVNVTLSLNGFTAAFDQASVLNQDQ